MARLRRSYTERPEQGPPGAAASNPFLGGVPPSSRPNRRCPLDDKMTEPITEGCLCPTKSSRSYKSGSHSSRAKSIEVKGGFPLSWSWRFGGACQLHEIPARAQGFGF